MTASHSLDPFATLADPGLRLLTGPRSLLTAGFAWLLAHLPPPAPLVVVDGAGCMDRTLLVQVADFTGEAPRDLAARVRVAHAATPYQMATLLESRGGAARGADAGAPGVGGAEAGREPLGSAGRHTLVLGPLDLLGRDDLTWAAEADLLDRVVRGLVALGTAPCSALVVSPDLPAGAVRGPRAAFVSRVAAAADLHLRFEDDRPVEGGARRAG